MAGFSKQFQYEIKIVFNADKELTIEELSNLEGHLTLQIDEPYNSNQENEDYSTELVSYEIGAVNDN
jgi:hypothetical protein